VSEEEGKGTNHDASSGLNTSFATPKMDDAVEAALNLEAGYERRRAQ